jgi:hypothetical protein
MVDRELQPMLAVLIDADNAQPGITEGLLGEVAKFGVASVKRIYGDWTNQHLERKRGRYPLSTLSPMLNSPHAPARPNRLRPRASSHYPEG